MQSSGKNNTQHHQHTPSDDSLSSARNTPRPIAPMPLPLPPPSAQKQHLHQPRPHLPYHPPASANIATPSVPMEPPAPISGILKPKQKRYRANPDQLRHLINLFNVNPSPTAAELTNLSVRINMPTQSVILWFKNRRARVPHKKAEKERRAAVAKAEKANAASSNASSSNHIKTSGIATAKAATPIPPVSTAPVVAERVHNIGRTTTTTSNAIDTAAAIVLADMATAYRRSPYNDMNGNNNTNNTNTNTNRVPRDLAILCSAAAVHQPEVTRLPPLPPPLPPVLSSGIEAKRSTTTTTLPVPGTQYPMVPALPGGIRLTVPANHYIHNTASTRSLLPALPPQIQAPAATINSNNNNNNNNSNSNMTTPRRPRGVHYNAGEIVEVLIHTNNKNDGNNNNNNSNDGKWVAATIISKCANEDPKELHLGASIVNHSKGTNISNNGTGASAPSGTSSSSEIEGRDSDDDRNSNTESPRTVQSPAASGSSNGGWMNNKKKYTVKVNNSNIMEVAMARMRPQPPMIEWSNLQPGDAVEAEIQGGWMVATLKQYNSATNKWGVSVDINSNSNIEWLRKDQLRAYQVWRGGNEWVQKVRITAIKEIGDADMGAKNKENGSNILLGKKKRSAPLPSNNNTDSSNTGKKGGLTVTENKNAEGMETRRKRFRKK